MSPQENHITCLNSRTSPLCGAFPVRKKRVWYTYSCAMSNQTWTFCYGSLRNSSTQALNLKQHKWNLSSTVKGTVWVLFLATWKMTILHNSSNLNFTFIHLHPLYPNLLLHHPLEFLPPEPKICWFNNILLVVCLSTSGERALNHTIVKRLILTTNTQATKIKSSF